MELKTRRVHFVGATTNPHESWMKQAARELTAFDDGFLNHKRLLIMDCDGAFCQSCRDMLANPGVEPIRLPAKSPNLNAYIERFFRSLKSECLEQMIFFGERSLRNTVHQYLAHYHHERNHQGLGNDLLEPDDGVGRTDGDVVCRERLGGLLRYYHREAASRQGKKPLTNMRADEKNRLPFPLQAARTARLSLQPRPPSEPPSDTATRTSKRKGADAVFSHYAVDLRPQASPLNALFDGRAQVVDGPAVVGQHAVHRTGILFGSVRHRTAMHQSPTRRHTSRTGSTVLPSIFTVPDLRCVLPSSEIWRLRELVIGFPSAILPVSFSFH